MKQDADALVAAKLVGIVVEEAAPVAMPVAAAAEQRMMGQDSGPFGLQYRLQVKWGHLVRVLVKSF